MAEPITPDRLRQVRLLLEDGVGRWSHDAVASLVAEIDRLQAAHDELAKRIANARTEIARQGAESDGELSFGALDAVEAHLVDSEYRPAGEQVAEALEGGA